jgi:hypothetical protein
MTKTFIRVMSQFFANSSLLLMLLLSTAIGGLLF